MDVKIRHVEKGNREQPKICPDVKIGSFWSQELANRFDHVALEDALVERPLNHIVPGLMMDIDTEVAVYMTVGSPLVPQAVKPFPT
jgi:hypothetical protein